MATKSTDAQVKTFANQLRSFSNDAGEKLNALKVKVHEHFAPADADMPYVLVAKGDSSTDPDVGDLKEDFDLEATVVGRSRADEPKVNQAADLVEQALIAFRESSSDHGLTSVQSIRRGRLDFSEAIGPKGEELIEVPVTAECYSWARRLTDALT